MAKPVSFNAGTVASFAEAGTADKLMFMSTHVDELIDEALAPEERSAVVTALLDSLEGEDEAIVAKAWAEEIEKRSAELRSGAVQAVPWIEARARLNAL